MITCPKCFYEDDGECRRFPPPFPKVNEKMWCGEGIPREAATQEEISSTEGLSGAHSEGARAIDATRAKALKR